MCEEMLCSSGFSRKGDSAPALVVFNVLPLLYELYESVCQEHLTIIDI